MVHPKSRWRAKNSAKHMRVEQDDGGNSCDASVNSFGNDVVTEVERLYALRHRELEHHGLWRA